jgi:hypothetical protein
MPNKKLHTSLESIRLALCAIGGVLISQGHYIEEITHSIAGVVMITCAFVWHHYLKTNI